VVIATWIIFLFWLDHALTISVIDRFFKRKEEKLDIEGWHTFRENYSKGTFFKMGFVRINVMRLKINLFNISVFVSFLAPPFLFIMLSFITEEFSGYRDFVLIANLALFILFTCLTVLGLAIWRFSGSQLYFVEYGKK
jgi:hypothetical protein